MAKSAKKKGFPPKGVWKKQQARAKVRRMRTAESNNGLAQVVHPNSIQPAVPVPLPQALALHASPEVLNRLWLLIDSRKGADPELSHSARLLAKGTPRVAQKLGEEAIECIVELSTGSRAGLIGESADVLYHLLVAWVSEGIRPEEVWHELEQREKVSYLSEGGDVALRRLLGSVQIGTTKIP